MAHTHGERIKLVLFLMIVIELLGGSEYFTNSCFIVGIRADDHDSFDVDVRVMVKLGERIFRFLYCEA